MKRVSIVILVLLMIIAFRLPCLADDVEPTDPDFDNLKKMLFISIMGDYNYFSETLKDKGSGDTLDVSFHSIQLISCDILVFFGDRDGFFWETYLAKPYIIPFTYDYRFSLSDFLVVGFSLGKSFMVKPDEFFTVSAGVDNITHALKSRNNGEEVFSDSKDGLSINFGYLTKKSYVKLSFLYYYGQFAYSGLFSSPTDEAYKNYEPEGNVYAIKLSIGNGLF
jgi:hypothetical protein